MYDIIGDIHGHSADLMQLLEILGYGKQNGVYCHPDRKVIFLGDFIDRGPQIRQVLDIVRPMVEGGQALAVMGNHEFNALAFHTRHRTHAHQHLRVRDNKNIRQHGQTLLQLQEAELAKALHWFRTLPMWLELDGLRAVHACWDQSSMAIISAAMQEFHGVTDDFMHAACDESNPLHAAVEIILKGKEVALPTGVSFADKDGHVRTHTRVRWYLSPHGKSYGQYALTDHIDCEMPLEQDLVQQAVPYPHTEKPVFVGHYWMSADKPTILAENVACIDYSVAKDGFLCAYRWQGEQELTNDHFVWAARG